MKFFRLATIAMPLLFCCAVVAQSNSASITGIVDDPSKAVLSGVSVTAINTQTGERTTTKTNGTGMYVISALVPDTYRVEVDKQGFQSIIEAGITLHTQDVLQLNFHMSVGSSSESVTVNADENNINTTDASVGAVIDRKFVEEIPLNGRSFQSLVLLSPGIVSSTPQSNSASGDYSVNGLPSDGNNFTLDGASASNTNSTKFNAIAAGAGVSGMAANATTLGTTQALISVDALQEFRISTSTYSAEYGRQPGAQISFESRSGSNEYHGTAFEYLRNAALDANNWFNDYVNPIVPKPQERQNDFGGVLGGPLGIPHLYSGKDRSFFFVSYEGLRLTTPSATGIGYVPSNGTNNTAEYADPRLKNLRANAPAVLQPILNAFPVPNCSTERDAQCVDSGDGLSPVLLSPSTTSRIDSISGRVDFQTYDSTRIFLRYSDTESDTTANLESTRLYVGNGTETINRTRVYLLGANTVFGASTTNELRLQYSPSLWHFLNTPTNYGGAQPVDLYAQAGVTSGYQCMCFSFASEQTYMYKLSYGTRQFQPNFVDTVSWQHGDHLFKAGANYIQTTAYLADGALARSPAVQNYFANGTQVLNNTMSEVSIVQTLRQDPTFKNMGVFFQDEWRARPRLSLSLGLRWDLSPSPSVSGAQPRTYAGDLNNLASLTLAPDGTPQYATIYTNFAPRFGLAAIIHNQPGHELVFRTGGGMFYGTGHTFANVFGEGFGLGTGYTQTYTPAKPPANYPLSYPIPPSAIHNPIPPIAPPYSLGDIIDRNYTPPMAIQWSVSLEQAMGRAQSMTFSYVGTDAPQLGHWVYYSPAKLNPLFSTFEAWQNGSGSHYNSLQIQYKRQALRGLQVVAGYTWSHAIDSSSTDETALLPSQRGNSDFDVRNNFNAALVYTLPTQYASLWQKAILGGWSVDMRLAARTAFPVQAAGPNETDPVTGQEYSSRLNYNGQYPYVYKKGIPGGRQFNPAVFSVPTAAEDGNGNAPRNFLRGFGYSEADISLQRRFPIYDQMNLLFRAEAFNIANHPAFGALNVTCGVSTAGEACNNVLLGQATSTLSNSMGGLTSLYQQGGPRSLQLALKLQF